MIRAGTPTVCIIGSGPAGAMVAARLANADIDVVVLEAGERFDRRDDRERMEQALRADPRTAIWGMGGKRDAYTVSGEAGYQLNDRRVKGIGGSTLHWGATVPRMHPEDFEMATHHGVADDWPIGYEELEPYYLAAEWEMGAAGAASPFGGHRSGPYPHEPHPFSYSDAIFESAFSARGITLHSLPRAINPDPYDGRAACEGFGTCNPVCPSGAKYTALVHVRQAEAAGAQVIERARVRRLEHDDEGERVERVVIDHDGKATTLEADLFVVACGAVETPRLLLLSASDEHPDGLANASGLVGKRFMEHVAIRVRARLDRPTRQHLIGFGTAHSEQYYEYDEGPQGSILLTPINTAGPSPFDVAAGGGTHLGRATSGDLLARQPWGEGLVDHVTKQTEGWLAIASGTELLPSADNTVTLDDRRVDDLGDPIPNLSFKIDDHARDILERAESVCHDILAETDAYEITTSHPPPNAYFANHQTGTTRMGDTPTSSVVDPNLKAHDLDNLYISGGSVFVTGGPANPTLTIAALALRLADHLIDRLD